MTQEAASGKKTKGTESQDEYGNQVNLPIWVARNKEIAIPIETIISCFFLDIL